MNPRRLTAAGASAQKGNRLAHVGAGVERPDTIGRRLPWVMGRSGDGWLRLSPSGFTPASAAAVRWVLVRDPQRDYDPIALLCTESTADPVSIVSWYLQRWQLEVTFEETRRHLGLETQRQGSDKAIGRITPLLLGLFSWITLVAHALYTAHPSVTPRQAAWYVKPLPTFSDALALVRQLLWSAYPTFRISKDEPEMLKIPKPWFNTLVSTLCYAA
jgi:hypothetical protein